MSGGVEDARKDGAKVAAVEEAAYELADALLATGDVMFHKGNPAAIKYANDVLRRTGFQLVKLKR